MVLIGAKFQVSLSNAVLIGTKPKFYFSPSNAVLTDAAILYGTGTELSFIHALPLTLLTACLFKEIGPITVFGAILTSRQTGLK